MMKASFAAGLATTFAVALAAPPGFGGGWHGHGGHGEPNIPVTGDASLFAGRSFDYVIAGGGLTGLTVASRLTENPEISVLVIEGGGDDHLDPRVYDVRTYGQAFVSDLDYNLTSTPVASQGGDSLLMVAGHTLGGSGSINGASWTKGQDSQYDILPILTGDPSWAWEPFNTEHMLEAENFHPPSSELVAKGAEFIAESHGEGGPVQVSFAQGMFGYSAEPALEASELVWPGLQRIPDAASGNANGATVIPNMVDPDAQQNRSSPYTAYVWHQLPERPNFNILIHHRVIEITWEDDSATVATGVNFQACPDCDVMHVSAKEEVLLACGSLQSPQLLELSGVGDADVLATAGVPLKREISGVGKHMQEQTKNTVTFEPQSTNFDGTGPPNTIALPNVHELLGDNSSAAYTWVMDSLPLYAQQLEEMGEVVNATATLMILETQVNNLWQDDAPAAEIFFTLNSELGTIGADLWNLIVLARGHVHITSDNSWDDPEIEPRYFAHPLDLLLQTIATRDARRVYDTDIMAPYVASETFPGLERVAADADLGQWQDFVLQTFTSVWHYIATLSMMKEEFGGVVDTDLKIYGIDNVRAIDASVLPIQLSAHLSSSLYGIAYKANEVIMADYEAKKGGRDGGHRGGRGSGWGSGHGN